MKVSKRLILSCTLSVNCNNPFIISEKLKEADDQLVIYGLKLKKLREKLEIIQNLHLSPQIYLNSIVEVLRRKSFSESFYKWSQSVSKMAREIIDAEVKQRNQFSKQLEKHFLKLFFPGMSDLPEVSTMIKNKAVR